MQYDPNIHAPWVKTYGLREPYGYCQCGCGRLTPAATKTRRLLVAGMPIRFCHGHYQCISEHDTLYDAFVQHVPTRTKDECWFWEGPTDTDRGYGTIGWRGRQYQAHRLSVEFYKPDQFDADLIVCHTCDNRACVNPWHLYCGTYSDNVRDMLVRDRSSLAKLTIAQAADIKRRLGAGAVGRRLAEEYGVSESAISLIKRGITWKYA